MSKKTIPYVLRFGIIFLMETKYLHHALSVLFILIVGGILRRKYRESIENKKIDWGWHRFKPITGEEAVQTAKAEIVISYIVTVVVVGLILFDDLIG